MNSKDRNALKTIVKDRFKRIRNGMGQRHYQAKQLLADEISKAAQEKGSEHTKNLSATVKKIKKLQEELEATVEAANEDGYRLSRWADKGGCPDLVKFVEEMKFVPFNTRQVEQEENAKLDQHYREVLENLDIQEQNLVETLILGDVSGDAKEWLKENVPTLENLMPLPEVEEVRAKLLNSGS